MKQILVNVMLMVIWLALTIGQVRLMHALNEQVPIGTAGAIGGWLLGQLVILSPLVWTIWRDRKTGNSAA